MQEVYRFIEQVAPSRSTVLIQGESGTGKELVAQAIHRRSPRAEKPFLVVNSSSIPTELLEDNLFGHVRGAFTGADADKIGLLEAADGGTVLFDEITTVAPAVQAKLLRVIQEKEFLPLGAVETPDGGRADPGRHQRGHPEARGGRAVSARTCTTG